MKKDYLINGLLGLILVISIYFILVVTNAKIDGCRKHFKSNIPTYYTKASKNKALIVEISDKINIIE